MGGGRRRRGTQTRVEKGSEKDDDGRGHARKGNGRADGPGLVKAVERQLMGRESERGTRRHKTRVNLGQNRAVPDARPGSARNVSQLRLSTLFRPPNHGKR